MQYELNAHIIIEIRLIVNTFKQDLNYLLMLLYFDFVYNWQNLFIPGLWCKEFQNMALRSFALSYMIFLHMKIR